MKKVLAVLILAALATVAYADHCRKNVVFSTGQIVTPYAVPVAVPVASLSSGYAYAPSAAAAPAAAEPSGISKEEWAEFQAWRAGRPKATAVSLVAQNCGVCHSANGIKADQGALEAFNISHELTADMKLKAAAALLDGSMPKGRKIDANLRGNIIGELVGVKPVQ